MYIDHGHSQLSMDFELLAQIANEPLCNIILALRPAMTSGQGS